MKKLALTMALVLVMGLCAMAQQGGGLLKRGGGTREDNTNLTTPIMPQTFGSADHQDGSAAPLGSGVAVLLTLGGAYLVAKKRKEE